MNDKQILIAPSILSADFAYLGAAIQEAEAGGADMIHVDVMDGHFVPNLTIGPVVVSAVRQVTELPLDVHLMMAQPELYLDNFAAAGAARLTVHPEACVHLHRILAQIRELGLETGVALNPSTSEEVLRYVLPLVDWVLVMTVNPGFGGQSFIMEILPKIKAVRQMLDAAGRTAAHVAVDGGINLQTAPLVVAQGADVLVAGSAVFKSPAGVATAISVLKCAADEMG
ncbi:MAG: ribulose-phosphate 3-epimerase [Anaerolineae bacterium]|nr:ribulose-phosphate 3-epimerase [Anaerolineae bacterium]